MTVNDEQNYKIKRITNNQDTVLFNTEMIQSLLRFIEDDLTCLNDVDLIARSPHGLAPTFKLTKERHSSYPPHKPVSKFSRHAGPLMSACQVAQILQYQDLELFAEATVATALDGIPSAYVRR